jgi:hypothetical protein
MHGPNTPRSTKGGKEVTQIAADCSLGHVTPVRRANRDRRQLRAVAQAVARQLPN